MSYLAQQFKQMAIASAITVPVLLNEMTGYAAFTFENGWNPVCDIDPTCRKLTDEEVDLARHYFGDTIDYSQINYFERSPLWGIYRLTSRNIIGASVFGHIYEVSPAQWTDQIFIHEVTHVWQYQSGTLQDVFEKIKGHDDVYPYDLDRHDRFVEYGNEQQASILADIHALRDILEERRPTQGRHIIRVKQHADEADSCALLNTLENLAAQEFPLTLTECGIIPVPDI